jgi:hypothetical protein
MLAGHLEALRKWVPKSMSQVNGGVPNIALLINRRKVQQFKAGGNHLLV